MIYIHMKDNSSIMLSEQLEYLNGFCVVYKLLSYKFDDTTHIQEYVYSVVCTLEETTFIFKVLIANSIIPKSLIKVILGYD